MLAFYLLKPDILKDEIALNYCYQFLDEQGIEIIGEYLINNWIDISKRLYEPDNEHNLDKIRMLRKQMITTIKGYQLSYSDVAMIIVIKINENMLPMLFEFKKDLRRKFVYNEKKLYLLFQDELPLDKKLIDINFESIKCSSIIVPEIINKDGYNLVYFNKIHFPDPTVEAVNRDLKIIEENGKIEKTKIKRKILYGK